MPRARMTTEDHPIVKLGNAPAARCLEQEGEYRMHQTCQRPYEHVAGEGQRRSHVSDITLADTGGMLGKKSFHASPFTLKNRIDKETGRWFYNFTKIGNLA